MVASGFTRASEVLVGVAAFTLGLGLLERGRIALGAAAAEPRALETTAAPGAGAAPAGAQRAPSVASYRMSARLDATNHVVEGKETIHFVNRSSRALPELYFHLYLNAFKNDSSVFLRSPFGEARSTLRATDWGYIDVTRCTAPSLGPGDLCERHR